MLPPWAKRISDKVYDQILKRAVDALLVAVGGSMLTALVFLWKFRNGHTALLQWIGGGLFGMATVVAMAIALHAVRVWRYERSQQVQFATGKKGFFDYKVDLQTANIKLLPLLGRISKQHTWLTKRMNRYSTQFNKLLISGGDPLRERRIADHAAGDLNSCSRQMEDCLDEFKQLSTLLTQSLNGLLLAWPNNLDVQKMIQQAAVIMIPSLQSVRVSQIGYKVSVQGIVGASETLNDAASRHVAITDTFIDLLTGSLDTFTKLRDDASERIKLLAAAPDTPGTESA